jgi:hypothetical protein
MQVAEELAALMNISTALMDPVYGTTIYPGQVLILQVIPRSRYRDEDPDVPQHQDAQEPHG